MAGKMGLWTQSSEARFSEYVEALATVLGREDRAGPLKDYCIGLLMPGERKSVEPMAAIIAPARVSAKHQSLLHLVGQAAWSDEAVLAKARELVLPAIEAQGKIEAWIVDDTAFTKKGVHSVGVARQYCGRLGKTDNCQIAVTLSIANHAASLPIAYQLYLPEDWAVDEARRKEARVPDDVTFRTKPEIALAQIRAALAAGVAPGVLLTDAGYGADGAFRSAVTASGLTYVVGVQSTLSVWPPGVEPLPPKPWSGRGRPPSRMRRDGGHVPVSAKTLARGRGVPEEAWRIVPWREGSLNEILSSRFAAVRIRPASRDFPVGFGGMQAAILRGAYVTKVTMLKGQWQAARALVDGRSPTRREGWWSPTKAAEPAAGKFSTLSSAGMASHRMARGRKRADEILAFDPAPKTRPSRRSLRGVDTAKLRWRIERDYEELKSELGLVGHSSSKVEAGADHTTPFFIAAYGFLIRERAAIPPSGPRQRQMSRLSLRPKPRGAANPTRTTCRKFDRHDPKTTHDRARPHPHALPMLPSFAITTTLSGIIVTQ